MTKYALVKHNKRQYVGPSKQEVFVHKFLRQAYPWRCWGVLGTFCDTGTHFPRRSWRGRCPCGDIIKLFCSCHWRSSRIGWLTYCHKPFHP